MLKLLDNINAFIAAAGLEGKVRIDGISPDPESNGFIIEGSAECGCSARWVNQHPTDLTAYTKGALVELTKGHGEDEIPEGLKELKEALEKVFGKQATFGGPKAKAAEAPAETVSQEDVAQAGRYLADQLNRLLVELDADPGHVEIFGIEAVVNEAICNAGYYKARAEELDEELKAVRAELKKIRKHLKAL